MSDIETGLTRRLSRKNPPQHLPAVLRAVATFAMDPPEKFMSWDVSERTSRTQDLPHGLGIHQVNRELNSLLGFGLVERTAEGYPYDRAMRAAIYIRTHSEDWAVAMEVLDTLRPIVATELEQPPQ